PRQAATARAAALPKPCGIGGVGIVLTALDGGTALCGLDLDSCRDPRGGNLAPWAAKVVRHFGSHTEVSPSKTGVILMRAEDREAILGGIRAAKGDPEVKGDKWAYGTGEGHPPAMQLFLGKRFFIVTGDTLVPQELRVVEAEEVRWRPLCCPVPAQKERCR